MSKPIQIELIGSQLLKGDNEPQVTPVKADGTYYSRDGYEFVIYYENDEGRETRNLIKFKEGFAELIKKGEYTTHLLFEPGKDYTSNYRTPYGMLTVNVSTKTLEISHTSGSAICIHITYDMALNGENTAKCELTISIKD